MAVFWAGFFLSFSLISAIGAQNAFVLRQGLLRQHVLAVCLTCALSDAILITLGVAGFGAMIRAMPWLEVTMTVLGVGFLLVYSAKSLRAAYYDCTALSLNAQPKMGLGATVATCLALTWLNPHVYLDTVVLLGSIAASYGPNRAVFGLGAICASLAFFLCFGFGARVLAPLFIRPKAWRVLDALIAVIMASLAVVLLARLT